MLKYIDGLIVVMTNLVQQNTIKEPTLPVQSGQDQPKGSIYGAPNTEEMNRFVAEFEDKAANKSIFSKLFSPVTKLFNSNKKKTKVTQESEILISPKSLESLEEDVHLLLLDEYLDVERCSEVLKHKLPKLYKKYLDKKFISQIFPLMKNPNIPLKEVLQEYEVESTEDLWNSFILGDELSLLELCNNLVAPKIREATIAGMVRNLSKSMVDDKLLYQSDLTPQFREDLGALFNKHLDDPTQKEFHAQEIFKYIESFIMNVGDQESWSQDSIIRKKYFNDIKNLFQQYSNVSIDKNIKDVTKAVAKAQLDAVADFTDILKDHPSKPNLQELRRGLANSSLSSVYFISQYGVLNRNNVYYDHQDDVISLIQQNYEQAYEDGQRMSLEELRDLFSTLKSQFVARYGALMYDSDSDSFSVLNGIKPASLNKLIEILQDIELEYLETGEEIYEAKEGSSKVRGINDKYIEYYETKAKDLKSELDQFKKFFIDIAGEEFRPENVCPDRHTRVVGLTTNEYSSFYGSLYNVKKILGNIHESGQDINLVDQAFKLSLANKGKDSFTRTVIKNSLLASIASLSKNKNIGFSKDIPVSKWQEVFINKELAEYEQLSEMQKKKNFSRLFKALSYLTDKNSVGAKGFNLKKFLERRGRPDFIHDFVNQIFTEGTESKDFATMGADLEVMTSLASINRFSFKESGVFDTEDEYTLFKRLRKKLITFLEQEQFIGNNSDPSEIKAFFANPENFQFYESLESAIKNACNRSSNKIIASFAFWYLVTLKYMPYEFKDIPEKVRDTYTTYKVRFLSLFADPKIRSKMKEALYTAFAGDKNAENNIKGLFENIEENHIIQVNKLNNEIVNEIKSICKQGLFIRDRKQMSRLQNLLKIAHSGFNKPYKALNQNSKEASKYKIVDLRGVLEPLVKTSPVLAHSLISRLKDEKLNLALYQVLLRQASSLANNLSKNLLAGESRNDFQAYLDREVNFLQTNKITYAGSEVVPWYNDTKLKGAKLKKQIILDNSQSDYSWLFAKSVEEEDSFVAAYEALSSKKGHLFMYSSKPEELKDFANLCNYVELLKPIFVNKKYLRFAQSNPQVKQIHSLLSAKPILIDDDKEQSKAVLQLKSIVAKSAIKVVKSISGVESIAAKWQKVA